MKQFALIIFIILIHNSCFGQASLALISEGKTVGWLLYKTTINTSQYLTPDGYIIILSSDGLREGTKPPSLRYESTDCSGQAYVQQSLYGEVFQLEDFSSPVFARQEHEPELAFLSINSQSSGQDVCSALEEMSIVVAVTRVNPADYGFRNVDGLWRIPIDSRVVVRPDGLFCNGFEGCPAAD